MKPLDVGGVDHRAFASLRTDQTSIDRLFSATHYYTPKNPDLDLIRVGGQLRVSDVNADEGSPYDAGSDTELPARI